MVTLFFILDLPLSERLESAALPSTCCGADERLEEVVGQRHPADGRQRLKQPLPPGRLDLPAPEA